MVMALDDEIQALLLSSLSDSWETLVASLNNSTLNGELTLDMAKENLLNEEIRRENYPPTPNEANVAEK